MKPVRLVAATILVGGLLAAAPVSAQSWKNDQGYGSYGTSTQPSYNSGRSAYGQQSSTPRPAASEYDRPTLGDSQPRIYGKEPTLGDSRNYRRTNPRTCGSLLCD